MNRAECVDDAGMHTLPEGSAFKTLPSALLHVKLKPREHHSTWKTSPWYPAIAEALKYRQLSSIALWERVKTLGTRDGFASALSTMKREGLVECDGKFPKLTYRLK